MRICIAIAGLALLTASGGAMAAPMPAEVSEQKTLLSSETEPAEQPDTLIFTLPPTDVLEAKALAVKRVVAFEAQDDRDGELPEPATLALVSFGAFLIARLARRGQARKQP